MLFRMTDNDRAFGLMNTLHQHLDELLGAHPTRATALQPDLEETETEYQLTLDLPGVTDADLELTLQDEVLTLSAKRELVHPEGVRFHLRERRAIDFTRAFALPGKVDADRVSARLENGVLEVKLAKAELPTPRRIDIIAG